MFDFLKAKLSPVIKIISGSPQLRFIVFLVVLLPLLLAYNISTMLSVSDNHVTTITKQAIKEHHLTLKLLFRIHGPSEELTENLQSLVQASNMTYVHFAQETEGEIVIRQSNTSFEATVVTQDNVWHRTAIAHSGTPVIYPLVQGGNQVWRVYEAFEHAGEQWYVRSDYNLTPLYRSINAESYKSYFSLFLLLMFLALVAWWLWRQRDYKFAWQQSEDAREEQYRFISMAVHELRAPLTAVRGYVSMMQESSNLAEPLQVYASRTAAATDRLLSLVNDFLEVSRIQSGQLKLKITSSSVTEVISKVVEESKVIATEKGLKLVLESEKNVKAKIDSDKLQQVATNILNNAIKYTNKGTVTIAIKELPQMVEIRIKDTGSGIEAEDQTKLFTPFVRVGQVDESKVTGTGLGMWITKRLTELMGGTIAVESIVGVGTHVIIRFPK